MGPAIFISAGEVSGDQHGAAVAHEIHARVPEARLFGLGGPEMDAAGVERIAGIDQLAIMGPREVIKRLPFLVRLQKRVERLLVREDVRLLLPIDYPGFNLRLARAAHRQGRRVLYFIAPQVWAWKEARANKLRVTCDRVLTVLPFEAELLERYGVDVHFVGHPLLDHAGHPAPQPPRRNRVGVFPGSRAQEVRMILPIFAEAARLLGRRRPELEFLVARAPHLPAELYMDCGMPTATARETMAGATAAMTKSGTITLELALAEVPMVVGYRTTRLEWSIGRRVVRVPSIVLVNLVAGEPVVPELLQDALTPERVASALEPLLDTDAPARRNMLRAFAEVRGRLGQPGCAARVAGHAVELLA